MDKNIWHMSVTCVRWTGLSVLETANILGFLHTTVLRVYKEMWNVKLKETNRKHLVEKKVVRGG